MLAPELSCGERAALAPQRLPSFAGGGDRGGVGAIFAAPDIGQISGAIASNFVRCGDRAHLVWFSYLTLTASSAPALRVDAPEGVSA